MGYFKRRRVKIKSLLITLTGTSGSGKSTIAKKLERKHNLVSVKSYTTRKPRENDPDDLNTHTFITFDDVEQYRDEIVASCTFNNNFYFTTKSQLQGCQIYVIDGCGLKQLKENYHDKEIVSIYLDVPPEIVAQRMERRGDSNEAIMQRLQHDAVVFKGVREMCDFVCDNSTQDKLNENVEFIDMLFRNYKG